jgi:hypothetical protein
MFSAGGWLMNHAPDVVDGGRISLHLAASLPGRTE